MRTSIYLNAILFGAILCITSLSAFAQSQRNSFKNPVVTTSVVKTTDRDFFIGPVPIADTSKKVIKKAIKNK
jgi:hypothetical protein